MDIDELYGGKKRKKQVDDEEQPIQDATRYARMQVQVEKRQGLMDDDFFKDPVFQNRLRSIDKFAPLSYHSKSQKQLSRVRSLKQDLLVEAGMHKEAALSSLDDLRDFQVSRGEDGFFTKSQITTRQEIKSNIPLPEQGQAKKRVSLLSRLFKGNEPEEEDEAP